MTLTAAEIAHVKSRCPCGSAYVLVHHEFGEGELRDGRPKKITRRFWHALYFSDKQMGGTDTGFCSVSCSLRWYETFWRPLQMHMGGSRKLVAPVPRQPVPAE